MANFILSFILVFLFNSCSLLDCVRGSGVVDSELREISDFTKITLKANANIYITQSDKFSVEIEAENNVIPYLTTKLRGEELVISVKRCVLTRKPIKIYISLPDLEEINLTGSGNIFGENEISVKELKLNISGSGKIDLSLEAEKLISIITGSGKISLSGNTSFHKIILSGSGIIDAVNFGTSDALVNLSGSGKCRIKVINDLTINLSGSGVVEYDGNPDIKSNITGSGKVRKLKNR